MHVTHGLKECEERETLWQCQGFKFYFRWYRHAGRYVCSLTAISILVILADDAPWRQSHELTFFPFHSFTSSQTLGVQPLNSLVLKIPSEPYLPNLCFSSV